MSDGNPAPTMTRRTSAGRLDAPIVESDPKSPELIAPPVVTVVVPCFNEAARIPALLTALRRWNPPFASAEVVAVDDGSTDDTLALLTAAAADFTGSVGLRVARLPHNRGKGAAVAQGIALAGGSYTVFLDADLSVGLDAVGPAISRLDQSGADMAFGSRRHPETVIPVDQPWRRQIGGRAINRAARVLGLTTSHDTQCGFKVLRREVAARLFPMVQDQRFAFDVELLYLADRLGYRAIEVPVTWSHHEGSTVSPVRDGLAMLRSLVAIRRRWRHL